MEYGMKPAPRIPFTVSNICFGTSPLGSMPDTYGYSVDNDRARTTIKAILELDHCFIDTSRNYGLGRSEERLGLVFRELGGLPRHCVLATKIDRDFETNRLDATRVRRSVEDSLEALGLDRLQVLHLHDPEHCADLSDITKEGGALDELFRLKAEGLVDSVGLAMGDLPLMTELIRDWDFDALVSHNRFTLLNRQADLMFDDAHERGIAIFNAAPYAGGMLAKGSAKSTRITYQDATDDQIAPVRAIEEICRRYEVPLGAAALQFSMRDPRITSTIVGVSMPARVTQTMAWAEWSIPEAAWQELLSLPFGTQDPEANRTYSLC
ncbi:oxidoreductase [Mesorhizobium loti NZP2037]|nr:aldo/keto reductase [Mesorhizobium loti]ANN57170.1 oxidoreductase [Mesorhizobium loti NZP2037]